MPKRQLYIGTVFDSPCTVHLHSTEPAVYELTPRQAEILDFILRHRDEHGAPPTRAEIVTAFGFRSPTAAEDHPRARSEEHTSELQSLMRISYAVFCLKKKKHKTTSTQSNLQYSHNSS